MKNLPIFLTHKIFSLANTNTMMSDEIHHSSKNKNKNKMYCGGETLWQAEVIE